MSFTEKIDVLDMLINILREHEEKLDEIVEQLNIIVNTIEYCDTYNKVVTDYLLSPIPRID